MFVFRKIWRALFSSNTRFEIRPFALLPTKCKASKRFQNLKLENNMPLFLPPRANEKDTKKIFPIFHSQEFSFFFFWTLHWNYNKRTYCNGSANWNHARYLFKNHFLLFINTILKSDYFLVYITSTEKWTNSILISSRISQIFYFISGILIKHFRVLGILGILRWVGGQRNYIFVTVLRQSNYISNGFDPIMTIMFDVTENIWSRKKTIEYFTKSFNRSTLWV